MTLLPMSKPNSPFIWGRGGRRMTMDDIALQRRLGAQQMAQGSDFSPVGHWTQGLARVANGLAGGIQMRRADAQAERNAQESGDVIAALLTGPIEGQPDPIAAALSSPYISDEARGLAVKMWEARQPKVAEPVIKQRNDGSYVGLNPLTGEIVFEQADPNPKPAFDWLMVDDPVTGAKTLVPVGPNGPIMGGGGPASGAGAGAPPATLPPDFDFGDEGGPTPQASAGFP